MMPHSSLSPRHTYKKVSFNRQELSNILSLYGRMVAAGQWRDYSLSFQSDVAIFAIFKRAAEIPLYHIEKRPKLRNKQGMYSILAADERILRRGHDLVQVLRMFERKFFHSVE